MMLVLSVDTLSKQLGPGSGSILLNILMVTYNPERIFSKANFEKKSADDKKNMQNYRECNELNNISGEGIMCHRCFSAMGGCGADGVNWRMFPWRDCGESKFCIKVITRDGGKCRWQI